MLPPWILTSILAVPPMEQEVKVGNREPHSMYQLVKRAHERSKQLGFDSSVSFDHFPQPPRSTHAAILHLTLPGDPSLSAGSILPMHMGTLKPPPLSQLEHDARRTLLGQDSDSQGSGSKDIPDEDTVVDDDPGACALTTRALSPLLPGGVAPAALGLFGPLCETGACAHLHAYTCVIHAGCACRQW